MDNLKQLNREVSIRQNISTFTFAEWVQEDSPEVELARLYVKTKDNNEKERIIKALRENGALINVQEKHNMIVTAGRTILARILTNDASYAGTGEINYGALGTGVSPSFTNASTQLSSEVYRKLASSQSFTDNIAYVDFFIASGDVADDTYTEFANFIDGTASADSGEAFSLLATGGWVKSGSMFISCQYTIS